MQEKTQSRHLLRTMQISRSEIDEKQKYPEKRWQNMAEKELVLFETEDKEVTLSVPIEKETVWLNRNQMAELFGRDVKTIGKHINNALREELDDSTVANFATVQKEGTEVIQIMKRTQNSLDSKQVLAVIEKYSEALELLDSYDHQTMTRPKGNIATYELTYEECRDVIAHMRFGPESATSALRQPCSYIFWTRTACCSWMTKS